MQVLGDSTPTIIGTGSIVGVLVVAFGYALSLLSKGTERIDKSTDRAVRAAEAERDRARAEAREEIDRIRAETARRVTELEHERDYWRSRAIGSESGT